MRTFVGVALLALVIVLSWGLLYLVVALKRRQYNRRRTSAERWVAVDAPPERALQMWRAQHDSWLALRGFSVLPSPDGSVRYRRRVASGFMIAFAVLFFPIGTIMVFLFGRDTDIVYVDVQPRDSSALVHLTSEIGPAAQNLLAELFESENPPQVV